MLDGRVAASAVAVAVAVQHGALVLFMVTGGLLGLRRHRVLCLHAPLTLAILGLLSLNTTYIRPYGTALGQVALTVFLGMYVGCLFWLRAMTRGTPTPRVLPPPRSDARGGGR